MFEAHDIKKYKLYYWDTSRSKESNAMVSGIRTYHLFVSSNLIEEVTLPELETIITHEIGHIKSKHLIKLMIGKIFIISTLISMIVLPNLIQLDGFNRLLFYVLIVALVFLGILVSIGVEKKYENEADLYASLYNDHELFASALNKITKYEEVEKNKIDELFQTHPDIKERIEIIKRGEK